MKHLTKILICVLLIAAVALSAVGCGLNGELLNRIKDQRNETAAAETEENADYQKKLDEILNILNTYYVDDYSTEDLGDYLAGRKIPGQPVYSRSAKSASHPAAGLGRYADSVTVFIPHKDRFDRVTIAETEKELLSSVFRFLMSDE